MNRRGVERTSPLVLAGSAVALALVVLPLVGLLTRVRWSTLAEDLTSRAALDALRLSLMCSLLAAAISVVAGTPLAWLLARGRGRGRSLLRGLVLLPMVLPPVVGGVALLSAFSLRSPIGGWLHDTFGLQLTFSTAGAVLAEAFVALPFFVVTLEGALRSLDPGLEEDAASLGAGRAMAARRVVLPLVAPAAASGAVLAWARALGEFGATVTFAGNVEGRTRTLPLAVALLLESDRDAAVALSLVLVAVSLVVIVALRGRWAVRR